MITIPLPEGLELPDSDTAELTAEFTVDLAAGTLTLIAIDGVSVAEDDAPEEEMTAAPAEESIEDFVAQQTAPMRG